MTSLKFITAVACFILLSQSFSAFAEKTPEEIKRQLEFGVRAAREDHWDEAIYRWQKVLLMDQDNMMAHNNLAVAYEQMGEYSLAMEEYQNAYKLNSESDAVKNNVERFKEFYRRYQQRQKQ